MVSPEWKEKVGAGTAVKWPSPSSVGGKGNEGVASQVKGASGNSIGYVEYAYALPEQDPPSYALLKNKAGKYPEPSPGPASRRRGQRRLDQSAQRFCPDAGRPPGEASSPIVGATYILAYKNYPDAAKGQAVLKFFDWAYTHGGDMAKSLHYVPLPENVVKLI